MPIRTRLKKRAPLTRYKSKAYRIYEAWWHQTYLGAVMSEQVYQEAAGRIGFARRFLAIQAGEPMPKPKPMIPPPEHPNFPLLRPYRRYETYSVPAGFKPHFVWKS